MEKRDSSAKRCRAADCGAFLRQKNPRSSSSRRQMRLTANAASLQTVWVRFQRVPPEQTCAAGLGESQAVGGEKSSSRFAQCPIRRYQKLIKIISAVITQKNDKKSCCEKRFCNSHEKMFEQTLHGTTCPHRKIRQDKIRPEKTHRRKSSLHKTFNRR